MCYASVKDSLLQPKHLYTSRVKKKRRNTSESVKLPIIKKQIKQATTTKKSRNSSGALKGLKVSVFWNQEDSKFVVFFLKYIFFFLI